MKSVGKPLVLVLLLAGGLCVGSAACALLLAPADPRTAETSTALDSTTSASNTSTTTESSTTTTTTTTSSSPTTNATGEKIHVYQEAPRSELEHINEIFKQFFTKPRSHDDQDWKAHVRMGLKQRMEELGYPTQFQNHTFEFRRHPATSYNIISELAGPNRHKRGLDKILLVGAHWDSYSNAPGVDDNGSGSACLLEIARVLRQHRCHFNHTLMFVWFDYEEQGKYGSELFVNEYLYPRELDKGVQFLGAYVLDMILVRERENNTQTLPASIKTKLVALADELERERNRGDFLATWARAHDRPLENAFRSAWLELGFENRTFKAMRPELPSSGLPNADERYNWKDFFRSDHASFWFPPIVSNAVRNRPNRTLNYSKHESLSAVLLTDLAPWRKSYHRCYHSSCDDEHYLQPDNLAFMQQVIDSLLLTLLRLGQGQCAGPELSGRPNV